ncbi:hypothetical protein CLIB1423_04S06546 [[Candida] railenensis]|uniref:C3H1-type domain-containing protein n=1 Tax=[Candida] railenensis TaxID=45579 RepID=A0A9P0VXE0_9ASCO|nr:hypothetical protein CLIB1423_04S06546 [[Candida] railenensis]
MLSHKRTQFNTPICRYFLENKCSNSQCMFSHNKPDKFDDPEVEIWVCRPFSISGVCSRGSRCPFLHLYICPDFQEEGTCPRGKSCSLSHLITQTTQRMILTKKAENEDEEDVLVESEDEEQGRNQGEGEGRRKIAKNRSPVKKIISSYTVDPHVLFDKGMNEKYSYYIDSNPVAPSKKSTSTSDILASGENRNTYSQDREFMIHLESSDSELDDLEENNDYVGLEYSAEDEQMDNQVVDDRDVQEVERIETEGDRDVQVARRADIQEDRDVQEAESRANIQEDGDVQEANDLASQEDNLDGQSDGELEF